jgi:epoxide hydrolase-like predicted phosphatase
MLFDVGGVIVEPLDPDGVWKIRDELAQELGFSSGEEMWLNFYDSDHWLAAKTGAMVHVDMWDTLLRPHGLTEREQQSAFVNRLHHGEGLRPEMRALIQTLAGDYKMGILSNWDDLLESILEEKLSITSCFDQILNSHRIGVAKPDEKAFRIALERLQARPEEVFFIDDQARNTKAAAALGIHTHTYDNVSALIDDLKARGLLDKSWRPPTSG